MEDRPFMATQVTIEGTVSATHDRYRYDEEAREWLQRWADKLDSLRRNGHAPCKACFQARSSCRRSR